MTDPLGAGGATQTGQSAGEEPGAAAQTGQTGQSAGETPPTATGAQSGKTYSEAEVEALRARMQAADRRASENEAALKQLRDKDMPELQKLQRDVAESQAQSQALQQEVDRLRIDNAFLTDNTHDWYNVNDALTLLDRTRVTVDSDGKVAGVKEALAALAKDRPHLLKPKPAEGGAGQTTPPPPGTAPANGGIAPQQGTKPSQSDLAKRFPALRQRLG